MGQVVFDSARDRDGFTKSLHCCDGSCLQCFTIHNACIELQVSERSEKGKGDVGRLRRDQGMLPGVVYGHNQEPVCFKIPKRTLERALGHGGADAVFLLNMEGSKDLERAVVREIQYHKVMDEIVHVDMLRIDPTATLRVEVPIVTEGIPEACTRAVAPCSKR